MYVIGSTLSAIEAKTDVNRNQVIRCINYAMSANQAGQLYGGSAFIPYAVKNYTGGILKKREGNFGKLINRFPELDVIIMWHSNDQYRRIIYRCNHKYNREKCSTPHVTEDEI